MILYHFTSAENLAAIRREGIAIGQVPVSSIDVRNGVWLTTDASGGGHGLGPPPQIPLEEVQAAKRMGLLPADFEETQSLWAPDKRAIRIKVKIPSTDAALKRWTTWAPRHLDATWYDELNDAGGGLRKARTWYVCFRTIRPDEFVGIDGLRPIAS